MFLDHHWTEEWSTLRARIAFCSRIASGSRITLGPHQAELGDVDGCFLLSARFPKHDLARLPHTQHRRLNRRSHEHRHGDRHDMSQTLHVLGSSCGTMDHRATATIVDTKAPKLMEPQLTRPSPGGRREGPFRRLITRPGMIWQTISGSWSPDSPRKTADATCHGSSCPRMPVTGRAADTRR